MSGSTYVPGEVVSSPSRFYDLAINRSKGHSAVLSVPTASKDCISNYCSKETASLEEVVPL